MEVGEREELMVELMILVMKVYIPGGPGEKVVPRLPGTQGSGASGFDGPHGDQGPNGGSVILLESNRDIFVCHQ